MDNMSETQRLTLCNLAAWGESRVYINFRTPLVAREYPPQRVVEMVVGILRSIS
jgi:hypothetical protein